MNPEKWQKTWWPLVCLLCIQLLFSHARLSQEIILLHVASLLGIHMTCSLFPLSLFRFLYLPPCSSASALTHFTICSYFLNCRHLFVDCQRRISSCSWVCRFWRSLQVQSIVNKMSWTPRIWMLRPPLARRWWREARAARTCRLNRISLRFIWWGSFRSRNLWWCFGVNSGDEKMWFVRDSQCCRLQCMSLEYVELSEECLFGWLKDVKRRT